MIGQSAGRSRRHPTAEGAIARSTPRQRAYEAPPPAGKWVKVTPREKYRAKMASEIWICVFLVGLGALIMIAEDSRYLEPFGLLPIVMAVALAGVSRPWRSVRTDLVVEEDEDVSDRH